MLVSSKFRKAGRYAGVKVISFLDLSFKEQSDFTKKKTLC
jgi:hypothetical protein